jgi:predicted RNase H-like nuclease (RuvC/YqgF family)
MQRIIPATMLNAWERATQDPDPMVALKTTKPLWQHLAQWQSTLVAEAVNRGTTWDEIGLALGTTRQAAWARFRKVIERTNGESMPMQEEISKASKQAVEDIKSMQENLKKLDTKWREEWKRLQDQVNALQNQLRMLDKQMTGDRKAWQQELRQRAKTVQNQFRSVGR